jgi:hypothetical protein
MIRQPGQQFAGTGKRANALGMLSLRSRMSLAQPLHAFGSDLKPGLKLIGE